MARQGTLATASILTALLVSMAGCSDQPADKDIAVVIPDPSTTTKPSAQPELTPKAAPAQPADTEKE